uniref:Uncharacterized protein n=1 Tax=Panagrolaimus davidi TaxID=227884 RepID=A0A914PIF3_9BILA
MTDIGSSFTPYSCNGPPVVQGSHLPLLTPLPDPVMPWQYVVTCAYPEGTTAVISSDANGVGSDSYSHPGENSISIIVGCDHGFYLTYDEFDAWSCRTA